MGPDDAHEFIRCLLISHVEKVTLDGLFSQLKIEHGHCPADTATYNYWGMSLVVAGSSSIDTVITADQRTAHDVVGGSGVYAAAAASLFTRPHLNAVVGSDFPQNEIPPSVDQGGIDERDGDTLHWTARYYDGGDKREELDVKLGVLDEEPMDVPESYRDHDNLLLANLPPDDQLHVLDEMNDPDFAVADTIGLWIHERMKALETLMADLDAFVVNEEEAELLAGTQDPEKAAPAIQAYGPDIAIITLGSKGSYVRHGQTEFTVPVYPDAQVVDPTGAGDTFIGGFMGYIDQVETYDPQAIKNAVSCGSVAASYCIQDFSFRAFEDCSEQSVRERLQAIQDPSKSTYEQPERIVEPTH